MIELLSISTSSLLTGLGVRFLGCIAKKAGESFRDLFLEDETKAILVRAFKEFKESAIDGGKDTKDEKILLNVFEEFFTDDRSIREFQLVFDAQSQKVNFDLLDEIFVRICIDKEIEIPKFNFFQAVSHIIKEIEQLTQREEKFQDMLKTAHLENIYSYLQKRGTENNVTFARFKYLDQLNRHHNRLLFEGIPDLKEKKDIELPSVFVMPRAAETLPVEDYRTLMRERQGYDESTGEEIQLRRMMMTKKEWETGPVKFDKVFEESTNRCFVVLGKPGSGKSTLLKFLALETARLQLDYHRDSDHLLFPILVEIRKLENALSKTDRMDYNILDFLYDSMRTHYNLTLPTGFFEEYLGNGRALLLFDSLDEVAAEARRTEIRQMISAFVTGYPMGNTVIVTSRIAGYNRAQFSATDYRHFTLEDFDAEEINAFIRRWYRSRLVNELEADAKANDLKNAFEEKPRIKELARNPLLLTIIGIIHRYEAQLPEDRLLLYDKATEALLYTWDNVKEIIDEKFKLSYRRRFLGQVAFHLQSLEKGDEAGTMIHRNDLYKILLADFCKVFNCDDWRAQELVNDFLETIRSRAGLLVELGPDRFGFAHKTFQEYFAARWIANETTLKFNLQIMIDYVDKFIDNAFWHETLILALQALPEEQALNVLKHTLERDTRKIEPYFYHNHYFVMKFIAEKGEWLNDKEFVKTQIDDFFRFSWNGGRDRGIYSNYTWKRFTNWGSSVSDSWVSSIFLEKLLTMAEDGKQDGYLRRDCAKAIGKLGLKVKAVEILLHLIEDEKQNCDLRRYCADAVGDLGLKDKTSLERLLHLAEDETQNGSLRGSCAEVVGHLGLEDKAVAERLLNLTEDEEQHVDLRRYSAEAVGNLGLKDKAVMERLRRLAEDEKHEGVLRLACAEAVGKLGLKDKAVEILLHLAEDEKQEDNLQNYYIKALDKLGLKDKAVPILLHLAEDKKKGVHFRCYCAAGVGSLGLKDKSVMERLLLLAEDEKQDGEFRHSSAKAVGELGQKKKAVEILLHLAEDTKQDGSLRSRCVEAVGNLGLKDKNVVERLHHLVENEKQNGELQVDCGKALGKLGQKDKAMEILLRLAEDEKQGTYLRCSCAEAVGILEEKDKAVNILIQLYLSEMHKYSGNARFIYNSLWKLTAI